MNDYDNKDLASFCTRISILELYLGIISACNSKDWKAARQESECIGNLGTLGINPSFRHLWRMDIFQDNRNRNEVVFWNLAIYERSCTLTIHAFYWYMGKNLFCKSKSWILPNSLISHADQDHKKISYQPSNSWPSRISLHWMVRDISFIPPRSKAIFYPSKSLWWKNEVYMEVITRHIL